MNIIHIQNYAETQTLHSRAVLGHGQSSCAIGMFDGVHLGHRVVLESALRETRLNHPLSSVVISFANHPQQLLSSTPTPMLSDLPERLAIFESMGFDYAVILDFAPWLRDLPAEAFIQQILVEGLSAASISVGYDHHFGKGREGNGAYLQSKEARYGYKTQVIDPVRLDTPSGDTDIVSSTVIRKLLSFGHLGQANTMLGRPYSISGQVVPGVQRGQTIGFPTANLAIPNNRLTPANGTYGGIAILGEVSYPAVCNIGFSPTFGDQPEKRVEVHLLNYQGEKGNAFYGEHLGFAFTHKLRDEKSFPSVEALIQQIRSDCHKATELLDTVERPWLEHATTLNTTARRYHQRTNTD
ncbi:MAG: riboflavin biosynthesis protein RibF [Cyanobacteria bacterium]|nr:riboflavin biosynthesis protein RibF [Cyanobacteriota bacterium]